MSGEGDKCLKRSGCELMESVGVESGCKGECHKVVLVREGEG